MSSNAVRLRGLLVAMATLIAAPACFSVSGDFGTPIPGQLVARIEPGETTREQITSWFGPPSAFARPGLVELILGGNGSTHTSVGPVIEDVYSYRYIESRVRLRFLPLIFFLADAVTTTESLTVFFDEQGVVSYHGFRRDEPDSVLGATP